MISMHEGNITLQTVEIVLSGQNGLDNSKQGTLYRMDDDICNPQVIWQQMEQREN